MRPVRARLRTQDGQVIVFVVAILVVLIGMGALVIDGGRWFQTQRQLQTAADAGALAGVQNLPSDPTTAQSIANTYAQRQLQRGNRGGHVPDQPLTLWCQLVHPSHREQDRTGHPLQDLRRRLQQHPSKRESGGGCTCGADEEPRAVAVKNTAAAPRSARRVTG